MVLKKANTYLGQMHGRLVCTFIANNNRPVYNNKYDECNYYGNVAE